MIEELDLEHDCDLPWGYYDRDKIPRSLHKARWRCQECGQRWEWAPRFIDFDRPSWKRVGRASRRWQKQEEARVRAELARKDGSAHG